VKPSSKQVVRLYEVRKRNPLEDAAREGRSSGLEPLLLLVARKQVKSTLNTSNHEVSRCSDVMARSYCDGLVNALTFSRCSNNQGS
jgi:hypothetical protein